MTAEWKLEIDGFEYQPIPESWIEHGIDDRDGTGPQLLAVSAATWRGSLRIRYAHPYGKKVGQMFEPAADGETGSFPRSLHSGSWPRSIAASRLEPIDDVRFEERQHLDELWSDRIDGVLEKIPKCDLDDERLIADGGVPSSDVSEHPAARHADQLAWAVWIGSGIRDSEIYAVTGDSEKVARDRAIGRADSGEVVHVDGPFQDSKPGVWEFEFVTEHRETVVVEAPNKDYASETADSKRNCRGELVQTVHTETRRLDVDPNDCTVDSATEQQGGDEER